MNHDATMEVPAGQRIRNLPSNILDDGDLNASLFYQKFAEWDPIHEDDELKNKHVTRVVKQGGWSLRPSDLVGYLHNGAAKSFRMTTDTRLLIGRGTPSVFEQGIGIHPLFGVPFLPGSAIKGVTQHWAMETGKCEEKIQEIFGREPSGEGDTGAEGRIVFYDAVPTNTQCLEEEVLAPHYPKYYSGRSRWPSDTEGPDLFKLPAIKKGVSFRFALGIATVYRGLESEVKEDDLEVAEGWVQSALREAGIGSKTGSNYGYFR